MASPARSAVFLLFLALTHSALADGGSVLAEQISGPYRVTLFASPTPLRAGAADLSVFIQDAKTGEAILSPRVDIEVQAASADTGEAWTPPCCSMKTGGTVTATHEAAQNKLLYAANTLIASSGPHKILVRLDGTDALTAPVEISPALPPVTHYWGYLALPPFVIGIFALNQRLRRRPET